MNEINLTVSNPQKDMSDDPIFLSFKISSDNERVMIRASTWEQIVVGILTKSQAIEIRDAFTNWIEK